MFSVFVTCLSIANGPRRVPGVTLASEPGTVYIAARSAADDLHVSLIYDPRSDLAFLGTLPLDYHTAVGDQRFVALKDLASLGAKISEKRGIAHVQLHGREIEVSVGPKTAVVEKATQRLKVFQGGALVMTSRISTGKYSRSTPIGTWKIGNVKDQYHSSAKYDDAPMPWAVHVTRNIFIHGGVVPDYPASHGCVRLPDDVAEWFYNWAEPGTKLTIRN